MAAHSREWQRMAYVIDYPIVSGAGAALVALRLPRHVIVLGGLLNLSQLGLCCTCFSLFIVRTGDTMTGRPTQRNILVDTLKAVKGLGRCLYGPQCCKCRGLFTCLASVGIDARGVTVVSFLDLVVVLYCTVPHAGARIHEAPMEPIVTMTQTNTQLPPPILIRGLRPLNAASALLQMRARMTRTIKSDLYDLLS